jgi:hypothetical protein
VGSRREGRVLKIVSGLEMIVRGKYLLIDR